MPRLLAIPAASALMISMLSAAAAQQSNPAVRPDLTGQVSSLAPEALYAGWRSRQLIGQKVVGKDGNEIGTARDLIIDADGRLAALIVEGGGVLGIPDALYRIPWSNVAPTPGRAGVTVDLSNGSRPQYGLFPGTEGVAVLPREFRLTEVVGDYARLQTGNGYGYVTDVVFSRDGRMIAVLVSRDAAAGGGAYAFPYPGTTGPWDPSWSYYGLPFVTEAQARAAGLRIDPKRFKDIGG
jgi:PRC-barrel domain